MIRLNVRTLLVMLLALPAGCDLAARQPGDSEPGAMTAAKPRVAVVKAQRKDLRRVTVQPGQIEAFDVAPIYARASGYVQQLAVDIGDRVQGPKLDSDGRVVEPGQVLAVLAAPDLSDELARKRALVTQAEASISQAAAAAEVAQTRVTAAEARSRESEAEVARSAADAERWRLEYERISQLAANRAVEQKLVEETKNRWSSAQAAQSEAAAHVDAARANVAEAAADVRKAQTDESVARAQQQVCQAEMKYAQTMLDYATLRAPFDGVVTERTISVGHFVQAGSGEPHPPLFVVTAADVVRVFLDVPEGEAALVDTGDAAVITVDALDKESFAGRVTRASWSLHAATRTLHTEIDIPNPDGRLRPGMFAHVAIVLDERKDVLVLPSSAIGVTDSGTFCTVIRAGEAAKVPITVGLRAAGEAEIRSGLIGDELVVRADPGRFQDGQEVEIVRAP